MPVGVRVTREGPGLSLPESLAGTVGVDDGTQFIVGRGTFSNVHLRAGADGTFVGP